MESVTVRFHDDDDEQSPQFTCRAYKDHQHPSVIVFVVVTILIRIILIVDDIL